MGNSNLSISSVLFLENCILCSFSLVNDCLKKVNVGLRLRGFLRLLSVEGRLRVSGDKPKKAKSEGVFVVEMRSECCKVLILFGESYYLISPDIPPPMKRTAFRLSTSPPMLVINWGVLDVFLGAGRKNRGVAGGISRFEEQLWNFGKIGGSRGAVDA